MSEKDVAFLLECPYVARSKIYALELSGVKFINSHNVYIGEDVEIGARTVVWPGAMLLGKTKIGEDCDIGPGVNLEDTVVGNETRIKQSCEIARSQIGNNCTFHPFCYISDSCIGDNCTMWVNISMLHAELKEYVVVHRDTRLVWTKIGSQSDIEASCQIKYTDIGADCRICHSIIEGEKFDDEILSGTGKRSILIGDSCAIGPWAYIYGKVTINPKAKIAWTDITNSFIGKRVWAYRCRISDSKIFHDCIIEEGAWIHDDSVIHPYCEVARGEITRSTLGKNTKSKHTSYIGDVQMGCDCNVGAGTVFGNYDGQTKHVCQVGDGAFIGINSSIVSKSVREIGDGAFIGAHMLVRRPVEANTAIAPPNDLQQPIRWAQRTKDGWELIQPLPSKKPKSKYKKNTPEP